MRYIIVKPKAKKWWREQDSLHLTELGRQHRLAVYTTQNLAEQECAKLMRATKINFVVQPINAGE